MRVKTTLSILLIASCAILIECYPASSAVRKKYVTSKSRLRSGRNLGSLGGNRRSSITPDYWAQRGFHEALTDHFLASEAQSKDFMMTGDEVDDFRGTSQIRIPRERLFPPAPPKKATRKQDMEVMESITLVDGGEHMPDGSIKVRPSEDQYERKYQDGPVDERYNPLNYHLQDELELQKQQQQQARKPIVSSPFHTLPNPYSPLGKESAAQKLPHPIPVSVQQFQQQILQQQQQQLLQQQQQQQLLQRQQHEQLLQRQRQEQLLQQQREQQLLQHQQQQQLLQQQQPPAPQSLFSPQPTPGPVNPLRQAVPFPVIPPPKPQAQLFHPLPQQQPAQQQQQPSFNQQLFQQQFQHPFAPPTSPQPNSLAQLTASLFSGAGSAAAVATTLAKSVIPSSAITPLQNPSNLPSPIKSVFNIASAASQSVPQLALPTSTPISSTQSTTTLRAGAILDDAENQVTEPENLATRLTKIYETGRKILYFPKGVMDTVDQFLKQVERNPTVAYLGDKFFAKVFGDTSQT